MKREIICEVDEKEAEKAEEELIRLNNSWKRGYNNLPSSEGGDVWKGRYDTNEYMEFVEKMSKMNRGKNNGMFGKKHSRSSKLLLKEKAKGRFSLPWFIAKYGKEDGTLKHFERGQFLKNRPVKKK